jgi:hypothetical protein
MINHLYKIDNIIFKIDVNTDCNAMTQTIKFAQQQVT